MSRTEKDYPVHVKLADPQLAGYYKIYVMHSCVEHAGERAHGYRETIEECDAYNHPHNENYCSVYAPYRHYYTLPDHYEHQLTHYPERRRRRDLLREAAKEYNSNGEVEDFDYPPLRRKTVWRYYL